MDAPMYRLILLVVALHASCVSDVVGNDYILRIDTLGYVDEPTSGIESHETTLRSIEVMVRPNFSFYGRVSVGAETTVLAGKLRPADNGEFVVQFKYQHVVDTGIAVSGVNGSLEPVIGNSSVQTVVTVPFDTRVDIGGLDVQKKRPGKETSDAKTRHMVTLTKYEPLSN